MRLRAFAMGLALGCGVLLGLGAAASPPAPKVEVAFLPQGVPTKPADEAWRRVAEARLTLSPQIITPPNGGGSVAELRIRAAHDGEWIAFRLEWRDPQADRAVGVIRFRDAAAVGFPLRDSEPPPSPFMGDVEHPVVIWQWTADRAARDVAQAEFEREYPHVPGVWYFPQDEEVRERVQAWRRLDPVVEFVARGFGTLEPRNSGAVEARSEYRDGSWRVVLRRRLTTGDGRDVRFVPGTATRLIAAVWNGAKSDVDGRKSVTLNWIPLELARGTLSRAR